MQTLIKNSAPITMHASAARTATFNTPVFTNSAGRGAIFTLNVSAASGTSPTLVVNPDASLRLTREEVFGPVVNLVRVADGEEALQLANDTEYGLTASVWTQNISKALEYTDRLQAGTVWVNSHTLIDANLPFGGMKQSGTGRDFGPDWLDGWCETKSVCVRY